ncbi:rho GTPase-activating protein SYDE2 isoform X4 [Hippopotamus amphibius kiboko]|uniref:rho GTPase-activating protein SYDE2 isoform X4 n=1 Tax=Hippopotamus amphibius kiboko TaxID=575201 RepID=UPI0025957C97|nr:rho GTPase-activating protein SYDE2 isoform X4 [Hippopotamus amphibius kiboko]
MRSAAPPPSPTPPAAELCQVCEQPARASVGHGEPPPPPPPPLPPRARLSAERGSELFPRLGRAWLLRRKGMTDPLRRTLSRLRGRRGPRAAGGHGLRAAAAATVAASSATEGDAGGAPDGPPGERASGAQPSLERPPLSPQAWGPEARVPGGRPERSGALGPRPRGGREAAPPGRGLTRASLHAPPRSEGSGEDEEDDAGEDDADYYENLPGGSQPAPEPEGAEAERWPPPPPAVGSSPGAEGGRLETGRLQTQLREAYYLLIQAMHDLPPDSGARRGDRGRADRGCPAGAWAPGQPPSPCGAADGRACPRDWERGGGGRPWQQVSPPRSPPRESAGGRPLTPRMRLFCSRSLDSLQVGAKPAPLQRWRSDSWIRCGARGDPDEPPPRGGGMDGWSGGSSRAAAPSGLRTPSSEDPGCSPGSRGKGDGQEGLPFLKPPAVTVKKLQKWMYKGRLLSLGMKGRARRTAPEVAGAQATSPHLGALNMQESQVVSVPPDHRITLTGPGIVAATNKTDLGVIEPSSPGPSPVKKGSSINWSFPDKIKSPRTVRKLSMKMKRLPELSRKLSVKGTLNYANSPDNTSSLSKCNYHEIHRAVILPSGSTTTAAKRNVISLYHLDTSVSSQHSYQKKTSVNSKYSCKGGYLSDGDSPELVAKSSKHGSENKLTKGKEIIPNSCSKNEIDIDAFRHYSFSDQPKCSQYISGLMSVHFYGAEDLKPPRIDSKDVFCAIQVDSVNKARTALLTCRTTFLDMDHTFNIEIENAQHLKLVVFSWEPTPRKNRVCCHGTVVLPTLFRVTKTHQLAVKLEPRGLIYVKVTLLEQWENSLHGLDINREPVIFGVDIRKVVEKENIGLMVPLLIQKCIMEIEKRGCQVVGLYRLCGSAAVKKELREAFERDSKAVGLCESQYPDINVITGVLKDYLRELPSPLITKQLYEAVLDAMAKNPLKMSSSGCENDPSDSKYTVDLLGCLPDVEKATLMMLLDHLKLVASYHDVNKMTCQNLAVCFGPVLLSQRQETSTHNNRVFTDSEELASALDFKKHIEVLHYLLQLWPVQRLTIKESADGLFPEQKSSLNYLRRKKERPYLLNLSGTDSSKVVRPRQTRLDSPLSNRYAGDWSSCGENYFLNTKENLNDVDYDNVPSEGRENGENCSKMYEPHIMIEQPTPTFKECTFQTYLTMQTIESRVDRKVNLKDLQESIDTLIGNLEHELNKNKLNMSV